MESYYEQSIAAPTTPKNRVLYVLCCICMAVLLFAAVGFAAHLFGDDPNILRINWCCLFAFALSLSLAALLFVRKDYLRMEYDYILQGTELSIWAIMNRRRRKCLLRLNLNDALQAGECSVGALAALQGNASIRKHKWYACTARHYIVYMQDHVRHAALLELDDQLADVVCRRMPVGTWQGEGRKIINAGLFG